jgi:hypothetical protein
MSEPGDIVRVREALKCNVRFRRLPEGRKIKLFQGMGKIREWLNDDIAAEDFSAPKRLRADKRALVKPLGRILQILDGHREISPDLIDCLSRYEQSESGKANTLGAAVTEFDAFRRTAHRLLTIAKRDEPSRLLSILVDRDGRLSIADPPSNFGEVFNPGGRLPIVKGFKPGRSQRKKIELGMVRDLLAEVFDVLSESEANDLAAAITVYTRAEGSRNGKPVGAGAIKKQKQRRRRG